MANNKNRMVQQVTRNLQSILEVELRTKVPYTQARRIIEKLDVEFTKNKEKNDTLFTRKKEKNNFTVNYNNITDKSIFKLPLGIDNNGKIEYWDWLDNSSMLITGSTGIGKSQLMYNIISYLESLDDDFDILYLHSTTYHNNYSKNINNANDFIEEISRLLDEGPRDKPLFLFLDDLIFMNRTISKNNDSLSNDEFQLKIHLDSLLSITRSYNIITIATLQNPNYASNYFFFNYKFIGNYNGDTMITSIYPENDKDITTIDKLLLDNSDRDIINTIYNKDNN